MGDLPASRVILGVCYPAFCQIQLEYKMNVLRTFRLSIRQLFLHYYKISFLKLPPTAVDFMAKGKAKLGAAARDRADSGPANADPALERTRGYQMEMFQESLRRNIIVAV